MVSIRRMFLLSVTEKSHTNWNIRKILHRLLVILPLYRIFVYTHCFLHRKRCFIAIFRIKKYLPQHIFWGINFFLLRLVLMEIHIYLPSAVPGPVLRSRHFFWRLRKSEVPEPTPAPTRLGRLQAKKKGGSGSIH